MILYKANLEALILTSPILTTQTPKQSTDVVYDAGGTYQTAPHRVWVEQGILYTNGHHGVDVASGDLLLESWDQQVIDWTARYNMPAFACKKCQRERKLCVAYDATKKHLRLLPLEHVASGHIGLITRSAFIRPLLKLKVRQQQADGALEDNHDSTDHSKNDQRRDFDEGYRNSHSDRFSKSHETSLAYQPADTGNGDNGADAMLLDM